MTRPDPGVDDTVRLTRAAAPRIGGAGRGRALPAAAIGALFVIVIGALVWWPRGTPPAPPPRTATAVVPVLPPPAAITPAPPPAAPAPAEPEFAIRTATEAQILDHRGSSLVIFRFADDPRVLVLDFASLHQQGMMLNRVAALTEKQGLPHDRVLTDAELDAAIRAGGDTLETYYYGHDYSVAELVRFFRVADRDHVPLHPEEEALRRLMQQQGWFQPGVAAALISIPQPESNPRVTLAARATILRHELSHGLYFSDPAYAAFVRRFWDTALTEQERQQVRRFLASEEYDTADDGLVMNEMQAYLMFTRDPSFFDPRLIGMRPERLAELQAAFAQGMPEGWLRDRLLAAPPVLSVASPAR